MCLHTSFQNAQGQGEEAQGDQKNHAAGEDQAQHQHGQGDDEEHGRNELGCAPGDPEEQAQQLERQPAENDDGQKFQHRNIPPFCIISIPDGDAEDVDEL